MTDARPYDAHTPYIERGAESEPSPRPTGTGRPAVTDEIRWRAGYACDDPDCCYDQDTYDTKAEAEAAVAPFIDEPTIWYTWVERIEARRD